VYRELKVHVHLRAPKGKGPSKNERRHILAAGGGRAKARLSRCAYLVLYIEGAPYHHWPRAFHVIYTSKDGFDNNKIL
jgi:hypothetical protein